MSKDKKDAARVLAVGREAQEAWDMGRLVFPARLSTAALDRNNFSGGIKFWAEFIEAIESVGWVMSDWQVIQATGGDDRVMAYPLFRRGTE